MAKKNYHSAHSVKDAQSRSARMLKFRTLQIQQHLTFDQQIGDIDYIQAPKNYVGGYCHFSAKLYAIFLLVAAACRDW